jgi:hypothetical protein
MPPSEKGLIQMETAKTIRAVKHHTQILQDIDKTIAEKTLTRIKTLERLNAAQEKLNALTKVLAAYG